MQCFCIELFNFSEIYEAGRWHADSKYLSPMASTTNTGHVFVGDVVTCKGINGFPVIYAKIISFIKLVCGCSTTP